VVIRASLACELTTGHAAACVLNANTRSATLCAERHHLCCAVLVSPPRPYSRLFIERIYFFML